VQNLELCLTKAGDELHVDQSVCSLLSLEPDENVVSGAGDTLRKGSVLDHVLGQKFVGRAGAVENLDRGAFVAFSLNSQELERQQLIILSEKILRNETSINK